MKKFSNKQHALILLILLITLNSIELVTIKNGGNKQFSMNAEEKNCKTIEECHQCEFNELKIEDECQLTGYKKRIKCTDKNNEDRYYSESCDEHKKFNSVYTFLIISLAIFICSYYYKKTQKDSTLQNLLSKLSILKE